jgi:hypothetical protein
LEGQSGGLPDFDDPGLEEDDEIVEEGGEEDPLMIDEEDDLNSEGDRIAHNQEGEVPKGDQTSKSDKLNLNPASFVESEKGIVEAQTTAAGGLRRNFRI